jgi:TonB family protein
MKTKKLVHFSPAMKSLLFTPVIIIALAAFSLNVSGQTTTPGKSEILPPSPPPPPPPPPPASDEQFVSGIKEGNAYKTVDEMPVFPGGDAGLLNYISVNTKYPKEAKEKGIQGQVFVRFIVKEDGTVSDVSILKSANPLLDSEAVRVVSTLSNFKPGKFNGNEVPVWFIVPITFALK